MTLFLHTVRLAVQQQITYRAATFAGLATNFFFGLLRIAVLIALYRGESEVNGMTLQGAITFVVLSQGLITFLSIFGTFDIMNSVYSGAIASDLLRPWSLYANWMARDFGRALVNLVLRGLLLVAMIAPFYPMVVPSRLEQWVGFILALLLGWQVSYAWRFLVNLASFWTPDARGFARLAYILMQLLSGFIMPLRLYPNWFAELCKLTPFPALFNTSIEAYLGLVSGTELWLALFNQMLWVIVLAALVQVVLRAGVRKLVIQGG